MQRTITNKLIISICVILFQPVCINYNQDLPLLMFQKSHQKLDPRKLQNDSMHVKLETCQRFYNN